MIEGIAWTSRADRIPRPVSLQLRRMDSSPGVDAEIARRIR